MTKSQALSIGAIIVGIGLLVIIMWVAVDTWLAGLPPRGATDVFVFGLLAVIAITCGVWQLRRS